MMVREVEVCVSTFYSVVRKYFKIRNDVDAKRMLFCPHDGVVFICNGGGSGLYFVAENWVPLFDGEKCVGIGRLGDDGPPEKLQDLYPDTDACRCERCGSDAVRLKIIGDTFK